MNDREAVIPLANKSAQAEIAGAIGFDEGLMRETENEKRLRRNVIERHFRQSQKAPHPADKHPRKKR